MREPSTALPYVVNVLGDGIGYVRVIDWMGGAQDATTKYALAVLQIAEQLIPEIVDIWRKGL